MKKLIAIILAVVLIYVFAIPAFATEFSSAKDEMVAEAERFLSETVFIDDNYRLSKLSSIVLGSEIPSYLVDSKQGGVLVTTDVSYYPVICEREIIGLLGVYKLDDQYLFSYSEGHAHLLTKELTNCREIALVWDDNLLKIVSVSENVSATTNTRYSNDLAYANPFDSCTYLSLERINMPRASVPSSYALYVEAKLQSFNWDCWAACTACVGQYYTGINYSSTDVALLMNITDGATVQETKTALRTLYNYIAVAPSASLTFSDIIQLTYNRGKPIIAGLYNQFIGGHMVVIYGYASGSSYSAISIMDPESGKTTVSLSNTTTPLQLILSGIPFQINEYIY